jgi:putative acetyltransferase
MIPNEIYTLRRATIDDASACALIVDDWIEKTVGMPRLFDKHKLTEMIKNTIPLREVWVIGQPINGYISYNPDSLQISALYINKKSEGHGKILLDQIKSDHKYLQLWSHEFNNSAHKFYKREGFKFKNRKDRGSVGIPELQFDWIEK